MGRENVTSYMRLYTIDSHGHGEGGINEMTIMNFLRAIKANGNKYKKLCMWEKSMDSRAVLIIRFLVSLFLQESHRY